MSDELAHESCPLCRRPSGPSSAVPAVTKLCEQCRSLVAAAFTGKMPAARQSAQSAAVLNLPSSAGLEYRFEVNPDPLPAADSLDLESALETEPNEETAARLSETRFDSVSEDSHGKEAELPEWDYSHGDWPVVLSPARRNPLAKFKNVLVGIGIFVMAVAFYFFLLPALQGQRPKPAAQERAPVAPKPAPPEASSQSAKSSEAAPPSSTAATPPNEGGESLSAHGKFALQAAAFASKAEAEALADKLKQAGVPSYVVSADLTRRGRWFRVRVGSFNTAEDAQTFAADAQSRAKSAGMSLQLMVVPYEQP